MKKIGIIIVFFLCLISIVSVSYASFLVNGQPNIEASIGNIKINVSSTSSENYNFTTVSSSKGFTYDNESNYILVDNAKIECKLEIDKSNMGIANQLGFKTYYIEFDITNNFSTIDNSNLPNIYVFYNDTFCYFNVSRNGNKFTATMPIVQTDVIDNNFLNYLVSKSTSINLVIDFSNVISLATILKDKTFNIEIGARKEV